MAWNVGEKLSTQVSTFLVGHKTARVRDARPKVTSTEGRGMTKVKTVVQLGFFQFVVTTAEFVGTFTAKGYFTISKMATSPCPHPCPC